MKRVQKVVGLWIALTVFLTGIVPISASNDEITKAKNYYLQESQKKLSYADDILAIEAIGLEVEDSKNGFDVSEFLDTDFTSLSAGALGKAILAICLMEKDPRDMEGVDLVKLLESYYQEDGSFANPNIEDWVSVGTVPFDVIALKVVNSKLDLRNTITYFTSQQDVSGAFGYEWNGFNVDFAYTGWAMLAMEYLGAKEAVNKTKQFIEKNNDVTLHGWVGYDSLDANTQSSILWPLFEMGEKEYVKEYQALLTFQCENGSFGYKDNVDTNTLATQQAMLAIGTYRNGSIIEKAKKEYAIAITPPPSQQTLVSSTGELTITGVLPSGVSVVVNEVKDVKAIQEAMAKQLQMTAKNIYVLDITILDQTNAKVQPNGSVEVKVKMPADFSEATEVYRQESDGTLTKLSTKVENGYIIFTTDHFSKYVLVEKEVAVNIEKEQPAITTPAVAPTPVVSNPNKENIVRTGDNSAILLLSMMVISSGVIMAVLVLKKKKA